MRRVRPLIECPYLRYTPFERRGAERRASLWETGSGCKLRSDTEIVCFCSDRNGGGCRVPSPAEWDSRFCGRSSYKVYKLRGKVVSTNSATGEVTLNHEAIPGFMDAMTMPYKLKDPNILSELHPGDVITADVLVSQGADASVLLDHIVVVAQGKPDYKPAVIYHVPAKGDAVPDFKLRNQDGRIIHLNQFRGKNLLITFIYTRCPLPNFCPLVTRNFAVIEKQLAADPTSEGEDTSALREL